MFMKITAREGKTIVAACDRELIGKVFSEGNATLDLKKYAAFYRGESATREELSSALSSFSSANLVGEKAVGAALGMGLADKGALKRIQGIPHIQLYKL